MNPLHLQCVQSDTFLPKKAVPDIGPTELIARLWHEAANAIRSILLLT